LHDCNIKLTTHNILKRISITAFYETGVRAGDQEPQVLTGFRLLFYFPPSFLPDMDKPELLAPAQDMACAKAAFDAGADSVYFGLKEHSMRATASNFTFEGMAELCEMAHARGKACYLTLNTIIYEHELGQAEQAILAAKAAGVDGIICWDFAVIQLCRKHGVPFHISTQASISNSAAARFYKEFGAERVVLARECSLSQIKDICARGHKVEVFIHGAMCVSESGRCFTSQFLFGRSANRGDCLQPCRREYHVTDNEEGFELTLDNRFVMSAKDVCTIKFIDRMIDAGVSCLKIEGRTKGADYVRVVVECYRAAIDAHAEGKLDDSLKETLYQKLQSVYNRGFSDGFYLKKPGVEDFARQYGSIATKTKLYTGTIANFYPIAMAADIKVDDNPPSVGDEIAVIGPTTGCHIQKIDSMQEDVGKPVEKAAKGMIVGIKVSEVVRKNDKVYVVRENESVIL